MNRRCLKNFFDCYLKNKSNDWKKTPRVRISFLNPTGTDLVNEPFSEFPLLETNYQHFYLNAENMTLQEKKVEKISSASYDADKGESIQFKIKFDRDVKICGYLKAHLFLYVNKEDSLGVMHYSKLLHTDYKGAEVWLRVSHRKILNYANLDYCYDTANSEKLQPEKIYWY